MVCNLAWRPVFGRRHVDNLGSPQHQFDFVRQAFHPFLTFGAAIAAECLRHFLRGNEGSLCFGKVIAKATKALRCEA